MGKPGYPAVDWSAHFVYPHRKLRERKIGAEDIEEAIRNGAIIEDYPDDPRGPSCLILGRSGGRTLHVVCGRLEQEQFLIITAYEPDPVEWKSDWRTSRR